VEVAIVKWGRKRVSFHDRPIIDTTFNLQTPPTSNPFVRKRWNRLIPPIHHVMEVLEMSVGNDEASFWEEADKCGQKLKRLK
jgi:hypothetical protein